MDFAARLSIQSDDSGSEGSTQPDEPRLIDDRYEVPIASAANQTLQLGLRVHNTPLWVGRSLILPLMLALGFGMFFAKKRAVYCFVWFSLTLLRALS